jgi:type IV secretory pathway VirB10-like protein
VAQPSAPTPAPLPVPATEYVCDLPQVWKEGDPLSDIRKGALAENLRWAANGDVIKKDRCQINAKTDAQLEQDTKEAVEKAKRDKAEAAKQAATEEKHQREDALAEAKRQREEAIAQGKRDREAAEQEKRESVQAARDHAKARRRINCFNHCLLADGARWRSSILDGMDRL